MLQIVNKDIKKNINRKIDRIIRVSTFVIKNNIFKIKNKHLIFKTNIARMKTCLLADNKNQTKLINEFFVCANKIPFFKPKKFINFILKIVKLFSNLPKTFSLM